MFKKTVNFYMQYPIVISRRYLSSVVKEVGDSKIVKLVLSSTQIETENRIRWYGHLLSAIPFEAFQ